MSKIAKDAFANRNYHLAVEIFERCLRDRYHQQHQHQQNQDILRHHQGDQHSHYIHHPYQNISTITTTTTTSSPSAISSSSSTISSTSTIDLYFWYGDSLARCGRLYEALDVYAHISNNISDLIPLERLKHITASLIDSVSFSQLQQQQQQQYSSTQMLHSTPISPLPNSRRSTQFDFDIHHHPQQQHQQQQQQCHVRYNQQKFSVDPLLCPICEDILRCPVTAICGHTFCRQCYVGATYCHLCNVKFPVLPTVQINNNNNSSNNNCCSSSNSSGINNQIGLKPDVLVRRLVDKWWSAEIQARDLNDEATQYLDINSLDDALKCCNESLEKCPNKHNSLLLRSEVLYRLSHFQSSLSDADNALKNRPTSAKAFYRRALALSGLGRNEDALISQCLAASLDLTGSCTSSPSFKNEVCRLLQRLLAPSSSVAMSTAPYNVIMTRRRRRRRLMQIAQNLGTSDYDEANSSCGEDDHFIHNTRRYSRRIMSNYSTDCTVPRTSMRLRMLLDRIQQEVQKMRRVEQKPHLTQPNPTQIEVSDFDCVLCCRTLWRPVVTPCGHTYCWVCLDRCMDYSSSCPLCMSPLVEQYRTNYRGSSTPIPFSLAKKSVTRFIEVAMQRFIPERYEKRQQQEVELEPSVPVFICTTAFPHVPCPLFVYEPRYRLMVRRAIESGERQFGIVQPHTGKSRYSDIGTMLDIRDCVLLGDGCSILSTIGCRRFKILTRDEKDGYETAKVEYIYDEAIPHDYIPAVTVMHASVLRKATKWYESLTEDIKEEILRSFGPMPMLEDNWETIADGPAWAWWIIAILPLNQQLKVNILATTSLEKRLRAIGKTLDYITGKVRRSQQSCVVVQCEGLPACQAIDCCQRTVTSTTTSDEQSAPNEQTEYML